MGFAAKRQSPVAYSVFAHFSVATRDAATEKYAKNTECYLLAQRGKARHAFSACVVWIVGVLYLQYGMPASFTELYLESTDLVGRLIQAPTSPYGTWLVMLAMGSLVLVCR